MQEVPGNEWHNLVFGSNISVYYELKNKRGWKVITESWSDFLLTAFLTDIINISVNTVKSV